MRIIINTTKLLSDVSFLSLSKEQIISFLRLSDYFGNDDGRPVNLDLEMLALLSHTSQSDIEVLIEKGLIILNEDEFELSSHINFFKNNLANVQKCLKKKKEEPVKKAKVAKVKKEEFIDKNTDWQKLMDMYNTIFKDLPHVSKLTYLDGKRGESLNARFEEAKKMINPATNEKYEFEDIYHFAESYFTIASKRNGIINSWPKFNGSTARYKFDFDFFTTREKFFNIIEKNMYN